MFATKLLVTLGNTVALFYLLSFLRDRIGQAHAEAEQSVLLLTIVYAVAVLAVVVVSGRLSDRAGRRVPFVVGSALAVGAACLVMAVASELWHVVVAAGLLGLGCACSRRWIRRSSTRCCRAPTTGAATSAS